MDAGWTLTIVEGIVILGLLILYLRTIGLETQYKTDTPGTQAFLSFIRTLILYLPNAFFMFGFIADLVNNSYHYTIPSVTALCGMVITKLIGLITSTILRSYSPDMTGGAVLSSCSLPGFQILENMIAPQGIVMSMTILWYIMIEMWDTGQVKNTLGLGITTGVLFIVQWANLYANKCLDCYHLGNWSAVLALVLGITFAGSSYGIVKRIMPSSIPKPNNNVTNKPPLSSNSFDDIINVGGKDPQSLPVDDDDQFVCEAYKDGELVTSTIVD